MAQVPRDFGFCSKVWEELTVPAYANLPRYGAKGGTANPQEIREVIEREINRGQGKESTGLDQNRALKILSVREEDAGTVTVVFKALQRLDWLNTAQDESRMVEMEISRSGG